MPSISPRVFQSLIYSLFGLIRKVSRQTLAEKSPSAGFDTLWQLKSFKQAFYLAPSKQKTKHVFVFGNYNSFRFTWYNC